MGGLEEEEAGVENAGAEQVAAGTAGKRGAEPGLARRGETGLETVAGYCVLLVVWFFMTTFLFQNFEIPSGSMEKTLLVGDHVLVDRETFAPATRWARFVHYREPRRGDVVVFLKPNPESPDLVLVKRLIGVPGDRIHLSHGVVYLNGVAQNEPYAALPKEDDDPANAYDPVRDGFPAQGAPPSSKTTAVWTEELPSHVVDGDLVVPAGRYFMMGDNREHSADSRFWGFLPRENILGRPLFNYWSEETAAEDGTTPTWGQKVSSFATGAVHFFDRTRWRRTGWVIR
jgi:signal peptidase I